MFLDITQGNQCSSIGHISLPLLTVCSNNVSILHQFQGITIYIKYITPCDSEKLFSFDTTIEIIGHFQPDGQTSYTARW